MTYMLKKYKDSDELFNEHQLPFKISTIIYFPLTVHKINKKKKLIQPTFAIKLDMTSFLSTATMKAKPHSMRIRQSLTNAGGHSHPHGYLRAGKTTLLMA